MASAAADPQITITDLKTNEGNTMINLLTGESQSQFDATDASLLREPWTAEAHLTAMRRLLDEAGKNGSHAPADRLLAAARVHAEAAKTASRTPLPVKTAPARTLPRDGDTV